MFGVNISPMKILCRTLFDCSYTGVTGHFRPSEIPFVDRAGQSVNNLADWHRSRNQQRNWETIVQILGLRTQPQNITRPEKQQDAWQFEFASESDGVYGSGDSPDPLAGLKNDCQGVPMIVALTEKSGLNPMLAVDGDNQNIWFETINNALD